MNNFQKYLSLPSRDKLLFFEALFLLYLAKLMLLVLPFRICIKTIKKGKCNNIVSLNLLNQIKIATDRANRLAFWKNVCLVKSFTARWMLQQRKIGSLLSIGVKFDKDRIVLAHACLKVNEFELVSCGGDYTLLKTY